MDKIVVTPEETRSAQEPSPVASVLPPLPKPPISLWLRFATAPLVLVLPLLCLATVAIRLAVMNRLPRVQLAWAQWLSTLLVISGLVTTLLFSIAYFTISRSAPAEIPMPLMTYQGAFPTLPSRDLLNPQKLVRAVEPLVFVISPDSPGWTPDRDYQQAGAIGAGVLLRADEKGFLMATNRHVVEAGLWFLPQKNASSVLVFRKEGGPSRGKILAIHKKLDLALVWTPRKEGDSRFLQPIAPFSEVESGQNVFLIGHPERLFFSLSTGIVMRKHDQDLLQVSAPVSPGNSGGPIYDEHGRLLAVVSFKVDRRFNPNAENLNFGVRADALLESGQWDLKEKDDSLLRDFWQNGSLSASKPDAGSVEDSSPVATKPGSEAEDKPAVGR